MRVFRVLLNRVKKSSDVLGPSTAVKPAVETLHGALFGKYLLTTNTVSSGVLMLLGDLMAQEVEYQRGLVKERYDWWRVGRMFIVGAIELRRQFCVDGIDGIEFLSRCSHMYRDLHNLLCRSTHVLHQNFYTSAQSVHTTTHNYTQLYCVFFYTTQKIYTGVSRS